MITLEQAIAFIEAGKAEAQRQGLTLSFAVGAAGGHLVAPQRRAGAPGTTPGVALGKAWTGAAWGTPSAAQGDKMKELHAFSAAISTATHGRFTPQIGGLPILVDGEVVGAMGASGASGAEDEAVVRAALSS